MRLVILLNSVKEILFDEPFWMLEAVYATSPAFSNPLNYPDL